MAHFVNEGLCRASGPGPLWQNETRRDSPALAGGGLGGGVAPW